MTSIGAHLARDDMYVVMPNGPMQEGPGYAWFSLEGLRIEGDLSQLEPPGMEDASLRIGAVVRTLERRGYARACILLAGYSQGAVVAADSGLGPSRTVAGIGFFSSAMVARERWQRHWNETSFFVSHGRSDTQVPFSYGEHFRDALSAAGVSHEFLAFDEGHTLLPAVIDGFSTFAQAKTAHCLSAN